MRGKAVQSRFFAQLRVKPRFIRLLPAFLQNRRVGLKNRLNELRMHGISDITPVAALSSARCGPVFMRCVAGRGTKVNNVSDRDFANEALPAIRPLRSDTHLLLWRRAIQPFATFLALELMQRPSSSPMASGQVKVRYVTNAGSGSFASTREVDGYSNHGTESSPLQMA